MRRQEYHTKILQKTLTSHESHFPVLCKLKMSRKIPKSHPKFTKSVWNLKNLEVEDKRLSYLSLRDNKLSAVVQSNIFHDVDKECEKLENIINLSAQNSIGKIQKTYLTCGSSKRCKKDKVLQDLNKTLNTLMKEATSSSEVVRQDINFHLRRIKEDIKNHKNSKKKKETIKKINRINRFLVDNDSKNVYNEAKSFLEPDKKPCITALRDKYGVVHTENNKVLEILRETFQNTFKKRKLYSNKNHKNKVQNKNNRTHPC